jgi:signal transduction histidine kinase
MTSPPATTFGCTVRDVTSQVSLQEDLLAAQTKLRELHAYFESVREEERRSIARELHDELGHELTALKMDLRWLQHVGADRDADGVRRRVDGMLELTDRSIQWIRRVSSELRPSLLDDVGLAAAVEWKAEEFERHTDMCCTVRVPKDPRPIESRKATALYRILQEALTNAARHSQADAVGIVLEQDDEVVTLRVCDNGRGITQTEANDPDAFGLLGIRERARVLGGSAHVYGNEAEGTTVAVRMPYEQGVSES